MRILHCVAGVLDDCQGKVLLATRPKGKPYAGFHEFPGGKLEIDETPENALYREMKEELGIEIDITSLKPITFASHLYPDFHLVMPLYHITRWQGDIEPQEGQEFVWVAYKDLPKFADKVPEANILLLDRVAASLS